MSLKSFGMHLNRCGCCLVFCLLFVVWCFGLLFVCLLFVCLSACCLFVCLVVVCYSALFFLIYLFVCLFVCLLVCFLFFFCSFVEQSLFLCCFPSSQPILPFQPSRTAGTVFINGVAWLALNKLGWRYLVGLASAPVALGALSCYFLPESARWLQSKGRHSEAIAVLRRAAVANGKGDVFPRTTQLVDKSESSNNTCSNDHDDKKKNICNNDNNNNNNNNHNNNSSNSNSINTNEATPLMSEAQQKPPHDEEGGLADIFNKSTRFTTAMLWIVWGSFGFW